MQRRKRRMGDALQIVIAYHMCSGRIDPPVPSIPQLHSKPPSNIFAVVAGHVVFNGDACYLCSRQK